MPVDVDNSANAAGSSYGQIHIFLTAANASDLFAHAQATGADLRISPDGVKVLKYCRLHWDVAGQFAILATTNPFTAGSAHSSLRVYYNNPTAPDVSDPVGTFTFAAPAITDILSQAQISGPYNSFPTFQFAANGTCIVLSNVASDHVQNNAKIYLQLSSDGISYSNASLVSPGTGNAATAFCGTTLANGNCLAYIGVGTNAQINSGKGPIYIIKSTDNGSTWTNYAAQNPMTLPAGISGNVCVVFTPAIETSAGGDLWVLLECVQGTDTKDSVVLMVCASGNDPTDGTKYALFGGSLSAATVLRDSSQVLSYNEASIIKYATNSYFVVCRVDGSGNPYLVYTRTTNGGTTWAAPTKLTFAGGPATLEGQAPQLKVGPNGEFILAYSKRTTGTQGIAFMISTDQGSTWWCPALVPLPGTQATQNDFGYAQFDVKSDGTIVGAFYAEPTNVNGTTDVYAIKPFSLGYIPNQFNFFDNFEAGSFNARWSVTTDCTLDTTNPHSGTQCAKLNCNSGANGILQTDNWLTGDTQRYPTQIGYGGFVRPDTINSIGVFIEEQDTTGTHDNFLARADSVSNPMPWKYFNGTTYVAWPGAGTMPQASYTHTLFNCDHNDGRFESVLGGANQGHVTGNNTGTIAKRLGLSGNNAASNNIIRWDDWYACQWWKSLPVITIGAPVGAQLPYMPGMSGAMSELCGALSA